MADNLYENSDYVKMALDAGQHRKLVGGMWDEIGQLQFDFLLNHGLCQNHALIDVGCGALRGGTKCIDYLDPFKYFGTDINMNLIQIGIDQELSDESKLKISLENFRAALFLRLFLKASVRIWRTLLIRGMVELLLILTKILFIISSTILFEWAKAWAGKLIG